VTVVEVETVTDSETPEVEDSDSVVEDAPEDAETLAHSDCWRVRAVWRSAAVQFD